jgi:uncharacterized Zn-binding protein involved in type VI secretion
MKKLLAVLLFLVSFGAVAADTKITDLSAFSQAAPATDLLVGVDVSDPTMAVSGTDKKFTMDFLRYAVLNDAQGCALTYSSTTAVIVNDCNIGVNGKSVSFSQTTYTSASTLKDIANSTVTLAASKMYWVFISDAGVIGVEVNDGTGDGVTPVFDTTFGYWKAASSGSTWRRIGVLWTNGSSQIMSFKMQNYGRMRRITLISGAIGLTVAGSGQSTTFAAVTITPWITADMEEYTVSPAMNKGAAGAGAAISELTVDGGTTSIYYNYVVAAAAGFDIFPPIILPYTGTLHYKTDIATTTVSIALIAASFRI